MWYPFLLSTYTNTSETVGLMALEGSSALLDDLVLHHRSNHFLLTTMEKRTFLELAVGVHLWMEGWNRPWSCDVTLDRCLFLRERDNGWIDAHADSRIVDGWWMDALPHWWMDEREILHVHRDSLHLTLGLCPTILRHHLPFYYPHSVNHPHDQIPDLCIHNTCHSIIKVYMMHDRDLVPWSYFLGGVGMINKKIACFDDDDGGSRSWFIVTDPSSFLSSSLHCLDTYICIRIISDW